MVEMAMPVASKPGLFLSTSSANSPHSTTAPSSSIFLFHVHTHATASANTHVACKKHSLYPDISSVSTPPRPQQESNKSLISHKSSSSSIPNFNKAAAAVSPNSCPLTPVGFLQRAAIVYGDCPSIVYNEMMHTWSETHTRCVKLASAISSLGIKKGDVVSVVAPNVPAMYELHFSVPMANATLNMINLRLDARTISILLQHRASKLIFVDHHSTSVVLDAISLFPLNSRKPILVLITESEFDRQNYEGKVLHEKTYEDMVKHGNPEFTWLPPDDRWEPITLNYTSDTTSSGKGVLHSHRARFIANMARLTLA